LSEGPASVSHILFCTSSTFAAYLSLSASKCA
jgi:hypothetical protein